ncbi:MAG: RNase H-like domain-containing protein [Polynucleobacter sp.]|nr:RNase H-like domain-containing protein [Polynucleobacter sp.]
MSTILGVETATASQSMDPFRLRIGSGLSEVDQNQLLQLLQCNQDVFSSNTADVSGKAQNVEHHIDTGKARPIHSVPYRAGPHISNLQKKTVDELLKDGVIRPSSSPWTSPVVMVSKKDGSMRFCVDYRKLNALTKRDQYPLPRIDDVLESLGNAKYFSTLDLTSGYWQIRVFDEDKEKTAFTTQFGIFEWNVMPFGLCNAPSTFQRYMDVVLSGLKWKHFLVYLDDIIVFGNTFEAHLESLLKVLQRLREHGLFAKLAKCHFCLPEIKFLGHVVTKDGIRTDNEKVRAMSEFPEPQCTSDVRRFLGLAGYYRRFVNDFARIAQPLFKLLEQKQAWEWGTESQQAFTQLKSALATAPVLAFPDFNRHFKLDTDASGIGIGAILSQNIDGEEKIITYLSRGLSIAEKNYTVTEQECLAVVWAVKKLRPYLTGNTFSVVTDHRALKWLMQGQHANQRLARWSMELQGYTFDIQYRKGSQHVNVDALSRAPVMIIGTITDQFALAQREDPDWSPLILYLESGQLPEDQHHVAKLVAIGPKFSLDDTGRLMFCPTTAKHNSRVVVPLQLKSAVLQEYHDDVTAGHLGIGKTYKKLVQRFFWTNMYFDVCKWIASCDTCCQKKQPVGLVGAPLIPIVVSDPWELIGIDIVGPLPVSRTGNKHLIVATDHFTKWCGDAFDVGELVWYRNLRRKKGQTAKLQRQWDGPFEVIEKVGPKNYRLRDTRTGVIRKGLLSVDHMKKYVDCVLLHLPALCCSDLLLLFCIFTWLTIQTLHHR